jgi:hypothetical protein
MQLKTDLMIKYFFPLNLAVLLSKVILFSNSCIKIEEEEAAAHIKFHYFVIIS